MFEEVRSQKFYLQIVNQIRDLIAIGQLKKGDKLPSERNLAQLFKASRPVIREALSVLEALGILECKQGQGDFIKVDTSECSLNSEIISKLLREHNPCEIFQARSELEPSLASLAAKNASEDDILKLEKQLEILNSLGRESEKDPTKVDEFMEQDRKFHLQIARSAHNSVLFDVYASVNLMMKETRWKLLKRKNVEKEGNIKRFEIEHTAIYDVIRDGKADHARKLIRKHIEDIEIDLFGETEII